MSIHGQRGLVFPARVDLRSERLAVLLVVGPVRLLAFRAAVERHLAARTPLPVA